MSKVLTISVAAYNVEKYLQKLIDSIDASGCISDIELLIVDDGSKDSTRDIAIDYAKKHPNDIFYIGKENGGHGSTINKGMELATAKYFKVLDGDDWVDPKGLKILIQTLKENDCDLFVTNRLRVYENTGKTIVDKPAGLVPNRRYNMEDACACMSRLLFHSVFVRTSILQENKIHIDEKCFYVDNEILWYPFPYLKSVYYVDTVVYCYRLGLADQSVNVNVLAKRMNQHEFVNRQMVNFYCEVHDNLTPNMKAYFDKVIGDNVAWHFEALLLLPLSFENWKKILDYRKYVKTKIPQIAEYVGAKAINMMLKAPIIYPIAWFKKRNIRG